MHTHIWKLLLRETPLEAGGRGGGVNSALVLLVCICVNINFIDGHGSVYREYGSKWGGYVSSQNRSMWFSFFTLFIQ